MAGPPIGEPGECSQLGVDGFLVEKAEDNR
jgi:hypothetical protein